MITALLVFNVVIDYFVRKSRILAEFVNSHKLMTFLRELLSNFLQKQPSITFTFPRDPLDIFRINDRSLCCYFHALSMLYVCSTYALPKVYRSVKIYPQI